MNGLEELKALEAKATPGRWRLDGTDPRVAAGHDICTVHSYLHLRDECEANRKLIPALRNLSPHLIAVAEAAEKVQDNLSTYILIGPTAGAYAQLRTALANLKGAQP